MKRSFDIEELMGIIGINKSEEIKKKKKKEVRKKKKKKWFDKKIIENTVENKFSTVF